MQCALFKYTRFSLSGRTEPLYEGPITNYMLTSNLARKKKSTVKRPDNETLIFLSKFSN